MNQLVQSSHLSKSLSELLFQVGSAECAQGHKEEGIRWLEKAHDIVEVHNARYPANDVELQVAILHRLARTFMSIPGNSARAWSIISDLDSRHNPRLVVLILILDYYDRNSDSTGSSSQEYYETVIRMMRAAHLTDSAFDTILHYIHQLRVKSASLASLALDSLILEKLLFSDKPDWLEKALITLIWNSTSLENSMVDSRKLQNLLDTLLAQQASEANSSAMSHAAHAVSLDGFVLWPPEHLELTLVT